MMWEGYNRPNPLIWVNEIDSSTLDKILLNENWVNLGDKEILNLPISFDIETSNWADSLGEHCCMYVWQMGIDGWVVMGRTWDEWINFLKDLSENLQLNANRLAYIYVHNLSYEFQWICHRLTFSKVFAVDRREPLYARDTSLGFEFRCTLKLSGGYSLDRLTSKLLKKYPIRKLVGNLDYSLIRHSKTPLTETELAYCINDALAVNSYIAEKIEDDGDIASIPLTNTGYVRQYTRNLTLKSSFLYRAEISQLRINSVEEYQQLKRAFAGGFTHANIMHVNRTLYDVSSYDIKSSYPSTICLDDDYPMSSFELIGDIFSTEELEYYLDKYCCIFDIVFHNIHVDTDCETILSSSRDRCDYAGEVLNNGKIVSATKYICTLTNLDYRSIQLFYDWDYAQITNLRISERGRLPRELVYAVLKLFETKTTLDGVEERKSEYMVAKNMLNADYGMMVTNIIRALHTFSDGKWNKELPDFEEQLYSYNYGYNRFLSYAWGVWVTAHARQNLYHAIYELGRDYVYSDTDSVKFFNRASHEQFFKEYNLDILRKIYKSSVELELPVDLFMPKSPDGTRKHLGVFEYEGTYSLFKTLGAKRYCLVKDNEFSITVAGLNKIKGAKYLLLQPYNTWEEVFDRFTNGMKVPSDYTGKLISKYFDTTKAGIVTDYLGNSALYCELSSTYLGPCSFNLSLTEDFIRLLKGYELVMK